MQRRWLMGWASPLAGSEEEAVAAWGPLGILVPEVLNNAIAMTMIPTFNSYLDFGISSSEPIMSDIDVDGHLNPKCGDRHGAISTGGDIQTCFFFIYNFYYVKYLMRKQSRKNMEEFYAEKPLLISMDHEWAYFDSADWALGMVSLSVHTKLFRAKTPRGHFDWIVKLQQEELAHKPKGPLWGTPTKVAVLLQRITRMTMLPISDFMLPIPVDLVSRQVPSSPIRKKFEIIFQIPQMRNEGGFVFVRKVTIVTYF
ncbi:hypothetical protein MUK42_33322 [Musa troglodytarum]|uniref:Uncharacterized protein n=1 Tax=Musa troglodytarum TaxID=320322 RepID=A0A9E7F4K7_9LILI|nr:hypothetical protein MUK42_33322 [Musa troglodytarum]